MKIDVIRPGEQPGEVCLYVQGEKKLTQAYASSKKYLETLCLKNGTTLEGSYASSGYLLSGSYKRPIYIGGSCNQIFIPTSSIKDEQGTWMSLDYCLRDPNHAYQEGGKQMTKRRWQKHIADGIALKYAIFQKDDTTWLN